MSIVPRPKDYKPKGLDGFKYEDMLPFLERAQELREHRRQQEAAAHEIGFGTEAEVPSKTPSENGTATHRAQRSPAPLTKP